MSVSNWGQDFTVVAGADLSGQQYKNVEPGGTLAGSSENWAGVLQNKPQSAEHARVRKLGLTKLYMAVSAGVGAFLMQSNANSGDVALATSGYNAFGEVFIAGNSGSYATVWLYGGAVKRIPA